MNRDDISRMARECGLTINDAPMLGVEHFANLVVAAEREACARVCEEHAAEIHGYDKHEYAAAFAHSLRHHLGLSFDQCYMSSRMD